MASPEADESASLGVFEGAGAAARWAAAIDVHKNGVSALTSPEDGEGPAWAGGKKGNY
jgi:hypothetical protein